MRQRVITGVVEQSPRLATLPAPVELDARQDEQVQSGQPSGEQVRPAERLGRDERQEQADQGGECQGNDDQQSGPFWPER